MFCTLYVQNDSVVWCAFWYMMECISDMQVLQEYWLVSYCFVGGEREVVLEFVSIEWRVLRPA